MWLRFIAQQRVLRLQIVRRNRTALKITKPRLSILSIGSMSRKHAVTATGMLYTRFDQIRAPPISHLLFSATLYGLGTVGLYQLQVSVKFCIARYSKIKHCVFWLGPDLSQTS